MQFSNGSASAAAVVDDGRVGGHNAASTDIFDPAQPGQVGPESQIQSLAIIQAVRGHD